jgi:hypothetical protein
MNTNTTQSVATPIDTLISIIREMLAPLPNLTGDHAEDLRRSFLWGYRNAVLDAMEEEDGILSEIALWSEDYYEIDYFISDHLPSWAGLIDFECHGERWEEILKLDIRR